MDEKVARLKKEHLLHHLKKFDSLLVAFSGGVDSTFLLAMAHESVGEKVVAATASSIIHPDREKKDGSEFVKKFGILHIIFPSKEMSIPEFVSNGSDRCYHCKRYMFNTLIEIAKEKGIKNVIHGANLDDLDDYRPGLRAANEAGVAAPLIDAELGKEEIRFLSKQMGLVTWDSPSLPCLATRIPYGTTITEKKLNMVCEAEALLLENEFKTVRVRYYGSEARIEIDRDELKNIMDKGVRGVVVEKFRKLGFKYVTVDLEGYIPGKMNRTL